MFDIMSYLASWYVWQYIMLERYVILVSCYVWHHIMFGIVLWLICLIWWTITRERWATVRLGSPIPVLTLCRAQLDNSSSPAHTLSGRDSIIRAVQNTFLVDATWSSARSRKRVRRARLDNPSGPTFARYAFASILGFVVVRLCSGN